MKYSYEEKLTAVLSVVRGQHSVSSASKHFGISYTPLSRWIARYKEFGEAGLRIRQYTYSGDFKLSAIRHMHENHLSLTETTAKFGIYNESTLSKWERIYYEEGESGLYRDNRGKMRTKPNKQELQPQEENDLRVENQRLRAEVAYFKKIEGLSRGTHRPRERERAKAIEELRPEHTLPTLLEVTGMARSTFYYHLKQLKFPDKYKQEKNEIVSIYHDHKGRYGYRRITVEMHNRGYSINHKTVLRLMNECGVKCQVRLKNIVHTKERLVPWCPTC